MAASILPTDTSHGAPSSAHKRKLNELCVFSHQVEEIILSLFVLHFKTKGLKGRVGTTVKAPGLNFTAALMECGAACL